MNCPVCHTQLTEIGSHARHCPQGHGVLVTAKLLRGDAPKEEQGIPGDKKGANSATGRSAGIACPHCGAVMTETNYCLSGVIIDTCLACPYRWLDAGELAKIRNRSADMSRVNPKALVAISGFNMLEERQAQKVAERVQDEATDEENWKPLRLKELRPLPRQFFTRPDASRVVGFGLTGFIIFFGLIIWTTLSSFPASDKQDTSVTQSESVIPNTPYRPISRSQGFNPPLGLLFLAGAGGYYLLQRWLRNRPKDTKDRDATAGSSLILAMYTMGIHLQKMASGTLGGYPYTFFITSEIVMPEMAETGGATHEPSGKPMKIRPIPVGALRSPAGQSILMLELPAVSGAHFAGFSLQDGEFRRLLGNTNIDNMMTRVVLEGDFPDYFRLYCDRGRELELLQVLDPDKMAYLVDFCNVCNWELVGNTLYFVQSHTSVGATEKTMVGSALEFAEKILPTLTGMAHSSAKSRIL